MKREHVSRRGCDRRITRHCVEQRLSELRSRQMSKRESNSIPNWRVTRSKLLEQQVPCVDVAALPQHERACRRGRGRAARELLARELHAMKLRQSQPIEMRLGALFVKRELLERPVGREDVRLAMLPQRVELVEVLFDDVGINGRASKR